MEVGEQNEGCIKHKYASVQDAPLLFLSNWRLRGNLACSSLLIKPPCASPACRPLHAWVIQPAASCAWTWVGWGGCHSPHVLP